MADTPATLPALELVADAVQQKGTAKAKALLDGMRSGGIGELVQTDIASESDAYPQTLPEPIFADFVPGAMTPVQMIHALAAMKRDPRISAVSMPFVDGLAGIILALPINDLIAARAELRRIEICEQGRAA